MKNSLKNTLFAMTLVVSTAGIASFASADSKSRLNMASVAASTNAFLSEVRIKAAVRSGPILSQAKGFGSRCTTPVGSCTIQPQPVGSPCKCGQVNGTTWQ